MKDVVTELERKESNTAGLRFMFDASKTQSALWQPEPAPHRIKMTVAHTATDCNFLTSRRTQTEKLCLQSYVLLVTSESADVAKLQTPDILSMINKTVTPL